MDLTEQKSRVFAGLYSFLDSLGENPHLCLFQPGEAAPLAWPVPSSSIFKANNGELSPYNTSLQPYFCPHASSELFYLFEASWDYIRPS